MAGSEAWDDLEGGRRVGSLRCEGAYGCFEGAVEDEVVFGHYRREGNWSPDLLRLLLDHLFVHGEGTFLDVGANIGLVSIPVAERRGIRCFAFEPEPRNFSYLSRNIEAHGVGPLIEAFEVALYSEEKWLWLALSSSNFGDHRVRVPGAPQGLPASSRRLIQVRARRLDDLLDAGEWQRPLVMKVDTQGCEVRVFRGAERMLSSVDYLIAEYWPAGLLEMGDSAQSFIEIVRRFSHGRVLGLGDDLRPLRPIGRILEQLAWVPGDGSDQGFFDVLVAKHADLPGPAVGTW